MISSTVCYLLSSPKIIYDYSQDKTSENKFHKKNIKPVKLLRRYDDLIIDRKYKI